MNLHLNVSHGSTATAGHRVALAAVAALLVLLAIVPAASADLVIGSAGSGAGQYQNVKGVAADTSTDRVYVADTGNNRVDVFDASGAFLFAFGWKVNASSPEEKLQVCTAASGCQVGTTGSGAGQLLSPEHVTVDSGSHSVYVSEGSQSNHRVQKFDSDGNFMWMVGGEVDKVTHANFCAVAAECGAGKTGAGEGEFLPTLGKGYPLAIGPGGTLYVADSKEGKSEGFNTRVQKFESSGAYAGQLILPNLGDRVLGLSIDSAAGIYTATNGGTGAVYKYDASGSPVTGWGESGKVNPSLNISAITVDPIGSLFVADNPITGREILEYDSTGVKTRLFFGTLTGQPIALAFHHTASGDLLAAESNRLLYMPLPDPGPLLVPGATEASPVGSVKATLKTSFNPEGKASTARFQYISKADYEAAGNAFGAGTQETPVSAPTPAGFENQSASATNVCNAPGEATCLEPETTYYFRAKAANADGIVTGDKAEFTTLAPVQFGATWASEVGTDSARLHAEANPLSVHATAYFQLIADGPDYEANGFQNATGFPANPLDLGAGEVPKAISTLASSLEPGTTYHYRLVATDFFGILFGPERTFTTFALPEAGEAGCPNGAFRTGPAAALPDCRGYEMVTPLDKSNGDVITRINLTGYQTLLDQSSVDGTGFTYSSYRSFADPEGAPYTNQYLARRDPDAGWQTEALAPPRSSRPFLANELENEYKAFSADLASGWLMHETEPVLDPCAAPGFAGLYRRDSIGKAYEALSCVKPNRESRKFSPELQGFTSDGSKALVRVDDKLTANASNATTEVPTRPIYQLYESTGAGQLRLISVLPDGKASGVDSSAGTGFSNALANHNRFQSLDGALSDDGTRVFWSAGFTIYLRLNADQGPSKLLAGKCTEADQACTIPVSETVTPEAAYFQKGNPEGTKALFTVTAGPLKGNLYRFDSQAEPPASQLIATGVQGSILGAGDDLTRVYFASTEASTQALGEGAVKGKSNVYLDEAGATRFIGTLSTLSSLDGIDNQYGSPAATTPIFRTARVSSDGQHLVFMSHSPELSEETAGYDNTDIASGEADAEVYLYDATADGGSGKLRCVSCNPSGARPGGQEYGEGVNGNPPPWAAAIVPRPQTQLYQSRYLSDDGSRVFFNSFDALVLGDTNGRMDVYQWEALDSGGCGKESPSYAPGSEGCLSLISSGQSPADSEFLDAGPSGDDVFFTTAEGLLPQDYGLIDVYDARVNGGFPPPPDPPAACEGEACQGPLQAPNDPTPASAAFQGAGNVTEAPTPSRCAKGKTRRKGRCVPKKQRKRAHKSSQSRANHERSGRRNQMENR